jgi:hypothetical protein
MQHSILFNRQPLLINVQLAEKIGLNESIFFQQLHYWLQKSTFKHDDVIYVYNTIQDWVEQFPFWSESTIKRLISSLVDRDLIIIKKLSDNKYDRTNYYTINYSCAYLYENESGHADTNDRVNLNQSCGSNCTNVHPENTTENTTEIKDLVSNVKNVLPQHEQTGYFLVLKDGTNYEPPASQVIKWAELYPNTNVTAELKSMIGWLDANPTKRKTKTGIKRFCNAWLSNSNKQPKRVDWDASARDTSWADGIGECF